MTTLLPRKDLILFNGLGGFTADGREYVMTPASGEMTPAPWVNVIANPVFGTLISENGQSYTWSEMPTSSALPLGTTMRSAMPAGKPFIFVMKTAAMSGRRHHCLVLAQAVTSADTASVIASSNITKLAFIPIPTSIHIDNIVL